MALAKRHVYGHVDIDSIAGPSEVVVSQIIRLDLTSQLPMYLPSGTFARCELVISWDESILDAIEQSVIQQVEQLERADLTIASLNDFGALILCRDEDQACEVTDWIAPEHLQIAIENSERLLSKIRNSGATFWGTTLLLRWGIMLRGLRTFYDGWNRRVGHPGFPQTTSSVRAVSFNMTSRR